MEYVIGVALAIAIASFAALVGLDRDRGFYPTVLMVVASYYVLFAAMGASGRVLGVEIAIGLAFWGVAVLGFKRHTWLVAAGIAGHGVFDFLRHLFVANSGVPVWWPGFCGAIDVALGGWLAVRLLSSHLAPPAGVLLSGRDYAGETPRGPYLDEAP